VFLVWRWIICRVWPLVDLIRECRTPDLFFLSTPVLTQRIPFCVLLWNPLVPCYPHLIFPHYLSAAAGLQLLKLIRCSGFRFSFCCRRSFLAGLARPQRPNHFHLVEHSGSCAPAQECAALTWLACSGIHKSCCFESSVETRFLRVRDSRPAQLWL
jgi:hypothetical protein